MQFTTWPSPPLPCVYPSPAHMSCTFVAFIFSYSGQESTPHSLAFLSPAHIIKNLTSEKHGERGLIQFESTWLPMFCDPFLRVLVQSKTNLHFNFWGSWSVCSCVVGVRGVIPQSSTGMSITQILQVVARETAKSWDDMDS